MRLRVANAFGTRRRKIRIVLVGFSVEFLSRHPAEWAGKPWSQWAIFLHDSFIYRESGGGNSCIGLLWRRIHVADRFGDWPAAKNWSAVRTLRHYTLFN